MFSPKEDRDRQTGALGGSSQVVALAGELIYRLTFTLLELSHFLGVSYFEFPQFRLSLLGVSVFSSAYL
jgi:hypothetical protein